MLILVINRVLQRSARRMRRLGEATVVSVSIFFVCTRWRSSSVLIDTLSCLHALDIFRIDRYSVAVRSAQKLGNTHGDRVCIERPHSLAKPEGILQTEVCFNSKIEIDEMMRDYDMEGHKGERA